MKDLSIIIPVGPGDQAWSTLETDLRASGLKEAEILWVGTGEGGLPSIGNWITAERGRACQLNFGARAASRRFLWFLHADSRVTDSALRALEGSVGKYPQALHFFDLEFRSDGPALTRFNAWGARFRSRAFGMPFGDQGFCVSREVFDRIGGFPEDVPYGEDHVFVWRAKALGIPLRAVGARISTSARKYREQGWLQLTLKYGFMTWKQAFPYMVKQWKKAR